MPERGYRLELITPVPLPRNRPATRSGAARVRRAIRQTRAVLDGVDADAVIGFGEGDALPPTLSTAPPPRTSWLTKPMPGGLGQPVIGGGSANGCSSAVPDPGLGRVEVVGAGRAAITSLDRKAIPAQARANFRVRRRRQGAVGVRRLLQGAPSGSTRPSPAAVKDLAVAGISGAYAHGPKNTLDLREEIRFDGDPPYVAVPYTWT